MSGTIIQSIDKRGVLGPRILVKKGWLQKFCEFLFNMARNTLAILGLLWVISWFF